MSLKEEQEKEGGFLHECHIEGGKGCFFFILCFLRLLGKGYRFSICRGSRKWGIWGFDLFVCLG